LQELLLSTDGCIFLLFKMQKYLFYLEYENKNVILHFKDIPERIFDQIRKNLYLCKTKL